MNDEYFQTTVLEELEDIDHKKQISEQLMKDFTDIFTKEEK
jgi:hypothetical protein